jgi:hypothetical protein
MPRSSIILLLAAIVLAAFLSRSSSTEKKEGYWSNAKGYVAMAGSKFPGETVGTGFGGTTAAAAACNAQTGCAGFMIRRGKKLKNTERPYWLVGPGVVVAANRQKNDAWTTYITKAQYQGPYKTAAAAVVSPAASTESPAAGVVDTAFDATTSGVSTGVDAITNFF